ncbi:MFS transporter [Amycolatopsis sp. GM8]|uniref:MFS transporter n=1 Tax=Amycolatopsis sp. GM8 TaxID=2896530 RepID=UPI0027E0F67E|nr:MFS transporter [Amycolatopsis sp. GM8]
MRYRWSDHRSGRAQKRVLVIALVLYSLVGTAPLWLPTLPAILVSRILMGIAEAAIFSSAMATISDLFDGHRRARDFGLLNLVTGLAAVVFIAVSGTLGNDNWRTPFWLYALALLIAIAAALVLKRDPTRTQRVALPKVDWRRLLVPIIFTLVGGAVFYVPSRCCRSVSPTWELPRPQKSGPSARLPHSRQHSPRWRSPHCCGGYRACFSPSRWV